MKVGLNSFRVAAAGLLVVAGVAGAGCSAPRSAALTPAENTARVQAALDGRTGTTELMSAQVGTAPSEPAPVVAEPTPRVGKAFLEKSQGSQQDEPIAHEDAEGAASAGLLGSPKDDVQRGCSRTSGRRAVSAK